MNDKGLRVDYSQQPPAYQQNYQYPSGYGYPQAQPQPESQYPKQPYSTVLSYHTQYSTNAPGYPTFQPGQYPAAPAPGNSSVVIVTPPVTPAVQVNNYWCLAITAIFFFWPTGIVALIKANQAQNFHALGEIDNAKAASASAATYAKISIVLGIILSIGVGVVYTQLWGSYRYYY